MTAIVTNAVTVTLPDEDPAELPGMLWSDVVDFTAPASQAWDSHLNGFPLICGLVEVTRKEINPLLRHWHPLGEYTRPFGEQHFILLADGEPIACASSGSVRRPTVNGGIPRNHVVELARIARAPGDDPLARRAIRPMLRLWTDYCAGRAWGRKYPTWDVQHAISYALPGKQGNIMRFDGWCKVGESGPWHGSTGWSGPGRVDHVADGRKGIWLYTYDHARPA